MTDRYWIPASVGNEQTLLDLDIAIRACHHVHVLTLDTLNSYFMEHAVTCPFNIFRKELGTFIREKNLTVYAQRYSLVRAAEKTFPHFNENKKIKNKKFILVEPIPLEQYNEIQIESRQIWRKYLALNNLITTSYGTIYLDEQWDTILRDQVADKGIEFGLVPFLIHSVLVRIDGEEVMVRFNLHEINSKYGKRARKEMRLKHA